MLIFSWSVLLTFVRLKSPYHFVIFSPYFWMLLVFPAASWPLTQMWGGECEISPPEHYSLQCTFGRTNCCFQWSLGCCRFSWAVVAWVFGHCSSVVALEIRERTAWFASFFPFHPFVSEKRGRKRNNKYRMRFSVKLLNNQTLVLWLNHLIQPYHDVF